MYRKSDYQRIERRIENDKKKGGWFKKNNCESVIFVPATPGSKLAREYRQTIVRHNIGIRVVERAGKKLKRYFQRNDPLSDKDCKDGKCMVCSTNEIKVGNCRASSVTYAIKCQGESCTFKYDGQTGKNAFTRGIEHNDKYRLHKKDSIMWDHCIEKHQRVEQNFNMKVIDTCRNDSMT